MRLSIYRLSVLIWLAAALSFSYGQAGSFVICIEVAGHTYIELAGPDSRCAPDSSSEQSPFGDDCRECIDLAFQTDVGPHTGSMKDVIRLGSAPAVLEARYFVSPADGGVLCSAEHVATQPLATHLQSTILLI